MTIQELTEPDALPAAIPAQRGISALGMGAIVLAHMAVDMQTSSLSVRLPPLLAAFNLTYASAAVIISANNIVIAIAQPLFGIFGDYRRARWLLPAGCALCGLAMASVMFMPSYTLVIVAVILSGLGSAAFHPEALSSVRAISGDQRATGSSIFFFGGNLGFAFGPLVAALLLDRWGNASTAWMLVPIALGVTCLWTQRRLYAQPAVPKPASVVRSVKVKGSRFKPLGGIVFILLLIAVRLVVSGGLLTFIPLYFNQHTALTKPEIARMLTILEITGTVGTLFSGAVAERIGRRAVIVLTMAVSWVMLIVFMRTTGAMQLIALGIAGATLSAPWTLSVIMMQDALPDNVGLASGLSLGTAYGAMGVGVALLGNLADAYGLTFTMQLITWLPAVVLLMGLFVPQRSRLLRQA
jgi:FSR family fosmidomycin resistance protein-like MFS transporter